MIPKLHKKGKSFRGAAAYLLHDKNAETCHRVAWTETRNLATRNPEAAWRVMAATALDQDRLKREAGVKATGRKSKDAVLHLTLSWAEHEGRELTREEMVRAAEGALEAIGAEGHQALLVAHNDTPTHPHLHILINRTSMTDGRFLSSSKEKLMLSRWAEEYERERGEILCEQREANNAARRGEIYTRAPKDRPRHIYELEAANDNRPGAIKLRAEQLVKDLELRGEEEALAERHKQERLQFEEKNKKAREAALERSSKAERVAEGRVRESFRKEWVELELTQDVERRKFAEREGTLHGRARNALRQVDWSGLLHKSRRTKTISEAFNLLGCDDSRSAKFRGGQERETAALEGRVEAAVRSAVGEIRAVRRRELQELRNSVSVERNELELRHKMENAAIRAKWKERGRQRREAWLEFDRTAPAAPPPRHLGERGQQVTKADAEIRSAAEEHMRRMREAREKRDRDRELGRDDDRGR